MAFEIYPTTAEHLTAATDAAVFRPNGCDRSFAAAFIDITEPSAENALRMATQLGLLSEDSSGAFRCATPLAIYLATGREAQKAAVLRVVLEQYEPYRIFKQRLVQFGLAPRAAEDVRALFSLSRHRDEIKDTLVNLGTYAQSLLSEGVGLFKIAEDKDWNAVFLKAIADAAATSESAERFVRLRLGDAATKWVDYSEVLVPLIHSVVKVDADDGRSAVVYAGNAIESFLVQLGTFKSITLTSATGINSKVDKLQINAKHKNILKYLGHVRNAADHGTDPEISASWTISSEGAKEYVMVAHSAIRSIVASLSSRFEI